MQRWSVPAGRWIAGPGARARLARWTVVATIALTVGCGGGDGANDQALTDLFLRIGESVGAEVVTTPGALSPELDAALNPERTDQTPKANLLTLPEPPESKLLGSARVTRADGERLFFVMYEVERDEPTVSDAMRGLLDETPWQVVGGQLNEGVAAYRFQSTRSADLQGTAVVQPLPTSDEFEIVVARNGKDRTIKVPRHAFVPVLGAELQARDGGVVVARTGAGGAVTAGLKQGDRLRKVAGKDITDTASVQAALRSLGEGKAVRTGVIYIVQVAPTQQIEPLFALPAPRPLPRDFPRFLALNGSVPIAVQWATQETGTSYQVTLLTRASATDVAAQYRSALQQQGLRLNADQAAGFATQLEFASADNGTVGTLSIDTFEQDENYTAVELQLQIARRSGGGAAPAPTSTPRATATGTGTPAR
ncbi:MAG: hypothetical protein EXR63_04070 [Dehalococcoidia bacterium]|nr:hypothetical protein [Dehalococcoidia bacterium]